MENFEFETAENFINYTNTPLFLTGKAGTGKTTFLRHIIRTTPKNCVVIAPTGVAAMNAGGVTIHSMFGLPTKTFIPSNDPVDPNLANNEQMLSSHFHYRGEKVQVLRELELLVIDEVSMVRADLLDAIDFALRYVRRNNLPFGGVQVLLIGDMYQLPPVVKDDEWILLQNYYKSHYFFDSKVFSKIHPVYIELKKIYRQSDRNFIRILNNIRHQDLQEDDYEELKLLYKPDFIPEEKGFITLTTHNKKADAINERELQRLEGREDQFAAEVNGDFFENMFPTDAVLRIKLGAQVMFVKNDTSGEKKYFNGKIGIVEEIDFEEGLTVRFPDTDEKIKVEKETWENIRYNLNAVENKIEQDRVGTFKQYPLRLAWAITIHKSQGLTFEKAVIDAGESFAPGQVYVALSRCISMENMVLHSLITNRNIYSDPRIVDFSTRIMGENLLENQLEAGKKQYAFDKLLQLFSFHKLIERIDYWEKVVSKMKTVNLFEIKAQADGLRKILKELNAVAGKFNIQLQQIIDSSETEANKTALLKERVTKAVDYFVDNLYVQIINPWNEILEDYRFKAKAKRYYQTGADLVRIFYYKSLALKESSLSGEKLYSGNIGSPQMEVQQTAGDTLKKGRKPKGETYNDTLELFRSGKSVAEIAEIRGMAVGTIEVHLDKWLSQGEIELKALMTEEKQSLIEKELKLSDSSAGLGAVKAKLGETVSFNEIRWVITNNKTANEKDAISQN